MYYSTVIYENDSSILELWLTKIPTQLMDYALVSILMLKFLHNSEVYIRASSKGQPFTIREVKASNIGQLVKISGIVTRCSDVKPLMQVAVYTCEECGFEIYQVFTVQVMQSNTLKIVFKFGLT